jgi:hypothetical protein
VGESQPWQREHLGPFLQQVAPPGLVLGLSIAAGR